MRKTGVCARDGWCPGDSDLQADIPLGSHAIRVGLLNRLGCPAEAAGAYESALAATENAAERAHLAARLA
jgi:predicted RNA polymerase sigma factor